MGHENGPKTTEELQRVVARLGMQLEESRTLASAREKVLKANVSRLESMYDELADRLRDIRGKGHEINVLNTLNRVIATASRYVSLDEILTPTLDVVMTAVGDLERESGRDVRVIGGGVFVFDEAGESLTLRALSGIRPESLGCGGNIHPGECICGLATDGEIVSTPNCLNDPRHTLSHAAGTLIEHAHVTLPLKSAERVTGIMFLYVSPAGYEPSEANIQILSAIGGYLGLHIERAMLYDAVQNLAIRDSLTGLFNHREFKNRLRLEIERAKRNGSELSLLLLDIDHFKRVNDELGHQVGDKLLVKLASIINGTLREVDTAARYGGEEFTVILPDTDSSGGMLAAERLRAAVEEMPLMAGNRKTAITVSIGLASFPADSMTEGGLIKTADTALYSAKEAGRNRVCAFSDMRTSGGQ